MPGIPELKALLDGQVKLPSTLSLEVVFDNKAGDVFDAIGVVEELVADAKLAGAQVRGVLSYGSHKYEVK